MASDYTVEEVKLACRLISRNNMPVGSLKVALEQARRQLQGSYEPASDPAEIILEACHQDGQFVFDWVDDRHKGLVNALHDLLDAGVIEFAGKEPWKTVYRLKQ